MPTPNRPHGIDPSLATARVVLVYKSSDPASPSHAGLGIVAACNAKTLRRAGIWAEVWPCSNGAHLLERLRQTEARAHARSEVEPTHVVINAPWVQTNDLGAMAHEFPNVVFTVMSHSNFGFLAADPHAVRLMREAVELGHTVHNIRVGGNAEKFTRVASEIWATHVEWLPNLYDLSGPLGAPKGAWPGDALRIGLFGACRILKNGSTAAAAAAELAARLRVPTELYVSEKDDGVASRAIEELTEGVPNLKLVNTGWLPWAKFRRLIGHMHILLQPSFTESFNVVTADGIVEGVPSVVSRAIDWAPARWQAEADDAGDVARVAEYLLHNPRAVEDGRRALREYTDDGLTRWKAFVAPLKM